MFLTGDSFRRVYSIHLFFSILLTHSALEKYTKYNFAKTKFGHWYYPLSAQKHSTLFGLLKVPYLGGLGFIFVYSLLLAALLGQAFLPHSKAISCTALVSCILYFARVRTHGLVHNKADTVPWVLAIFTLVPPANQAFACQLLLSLGYCSSGTLKVRKQGFAWAEGKNLQRMVAQFLLELQLEEDPTALQTIVLHFPLLASFSQKMVLAFECLFPLVLLSPAAWDVCDYGSCVKMGLVVFGASFHLGCYLLFSIDFLRFWLPTYWCFFANDASWASAMGSNDLSRWFCTTMTLSFVVANVRVHSGEHWPNSSFDLYNARYTSDHISYRVLRLQTSTGNAVNFDLRLCTSSGTTRSFGYHYEKMSLNERDLSFYLSQFLPKLLESEYDGSETFTGVTVVESGIYLAKDGVGFSPAKPRNILHFTFLKFCSENK